MRVSRLVQWAGAAFAIAFSACGDSTGSTTALSLSADQAGVLVSAMESVLFDGVFQSDTPDALAAGITVTCDAGGSALVKGTYTLATNLGTLSMAFHTCKVGSTGGLIVDGTMTDTGTETSETLSGDVTISGTQSGSCHIAVTITPHSNSNFTASGAVCGTTVSNIPI